MQKAYGDSSPLAFIPEFSSQKQSVALFGLFQTESEYVPDCISSFSSAVAREAPLLYFLRFISTPCELSCIRTYSTAGVFLSAVTCSVGPACYIPDFPYEWKGCSCFQRPAITNKTAVNMLIHRRCARRMNSLKWDCEVKGHLHLRF